MLLKELEGLPKIVSLKSFPAMQKRAKVFSGGVFPHSPIGQESNAILRNNHHSLEWRKYFNQHF